MKELQSKTLTGAQDLTADEIKEAIMIIATLRRTNVGPASKKKEEKKKASTLPADFQFSKLLD